jgi:hypothetical protein
MFCDSTEDHGGEGGRQGEKGEGQDDAWEPRQNGHVIRVGKARARRVRREVRKGKQGERGGKENMSFEADLTSPF